jgi:hypothetical protein
MPRGDYIRTPNGKKKWTAEEEEYLQDNWGIKSVKTIANHLQRSENAVIVRVNRLHLPPHLQYGTRVTFSQFWSIIHGYKRTGGEAYAKERLKKYGFPFHKQTVRGRNGKKFTMVDIDEFWKFAKKHQYLFDFSKFEKGGLGAEPDWVENKRRVDMDNKCKIKKSPWTKGEDDKLKRMLKKGCTYTDIAHDLCRTEAAVKRRLQTLDIKERPARTEERAWTEEEAQKLVEMAQKGCSWETIGVELNRSALGVRGKYERILNPEYTKRQNRNARERRAKHEREKDCTHFIKAQGCEYNETCEGCEHYKAITAGTKQRTIYVGIHGGQK